MSCNGNDYNLCGVESCILQPAYSPESHWYGRVQLPRVVAIRVFLSESGLIEATTLLSRISSLSRMDYTTPAT